MEKLTIHRFVDWSNEKLQGWNWRVREQKNSRERKRLEIKALQRKIGELRAEIKAPLPKRPDTSRSAYDQAKEETKKHAEERGWEFVDPEEAD